MSDRSTETHDHDALSLECDELPPELEAALRRAEDEYERGEWIDGDEFLAQLRARRKR